MPLYFHLLSHHAVVWGILSLLCVCLSFCLFVCMVTDFSAAEKGRDVKFCMRVRLSGQVFSHLVNIGSRGVTAAALLAG